MPQEIYGYDKICQDITLLYTVVFLQIVLLLIMFWILVFAVLGWKNGFGTGYFCVVSGIWMNMDEINIDMGDYIAMVLATVWRKVGNSVF